MKKVVSFLILVAISLAACNEKQELLLANEYQETVARIAFANYNDAYISAIDLQNDINAFTESPSKKALESAKSAWLKAREAYGQTEVFRFQEGPIDDKNGPEGLLNAWPLDEAYIDYVEGMPSAGIINDTSISITSEFLEDKNENGGEKNISVGYHAIEFLLWGQDDPNTALKTPGNRPYTDYLITVNGSAHIHARRAKYLRLCAKLLVEHLEYLKNEWEEDGVYRKKFLAMEPKIAIEKTLTGMAILSKSELASERMFVALDNQDQEDEHSCFSDNTHRDIVLNAQGIHNLYFGSYTTLEGKEIKGTSMQDILRSIDKEKEAHYSQVFTETLEAVKQIPAPFDYALTQEQIGGNGPIMSAVKKLQNQGNEIASLSAAIAPLLNNDLAE